MNGLLTLDPSETTFPSIDTSPPELEKNHSTLQSTAVALYEVGAVVGALLCFFIGEKFGREKTTLGGAVVLLIGVVLQATAYSLAQLIVVRSVIGVGVGFFTTATWPTWVVDVVMRSTVRLVMLECSAAFFGVMFLGWLDFSFHFVPNNNEVSWRWNSSRCSSLFQTTDVSRIPNFLSSRPCPRRADHSMVTAGEPALANRKIPPGGGAQGAGPLPKRERGFRACRRSHTSDPQRRHGSNSRVTRIIPSLVHRKITSTAL